MEAPQAVREAGLRALALRLGGNDLPGPDTPLLRRLTLVVGRLNELHYQAHWEAGADGARIILGHCPYAAIIAAHPELCWMDAFILEQRTAWPVETACQVAARRTGLSFLYFPGRRESLIRNGCIITL